MLISTNQIHDLTGHSNATVKRALEGVAFKAGPKQSRLYESRNVLTLRQPLNGDAPTDKANITNAEAQRQLTIARKEQIDLEMECTRKERIALDVQEQVNDEVFSNIAGVLKAHKGKKMTEQLVNDLLSELRNISAKVNG